MRAGCALRGGRRILATAVIASVLPGCGESAAPTATGSLEVTVTRSGPIVESDSVEVVIDDQVRAHVVVGHTVISGIATGSHRVELAGVSPVCEVTTDNPVHVDIHAGASTNIEFALSCLERATIVVSVTTQGVNAPGWLTYTVELDGGQSRSVRSTGRVRFETVPGRHSVVLSGARRYCLIGGFDLGPNRISVTVNAGEVKTIHFDVLCLG